MPPGVYPRKKECPDCHIRFQSLGRHKKFCKAVRHESESDSNLNQALKDSILFEQTGRFKSQKLEESESVINYLKAQRAVVAHKLAHFDEIISILEKERG